MSSTPANSPRMPDLELPPPALHRSPEDLMPPPPPRSPPGVVRVKRARSNSLVRSIDWTQTLSITPPRSNTICVHCHRVCAGRCESIGPRGYLFSLTGSDAECSALLYVERVGLRIEDALELVRELGELKCDLPPFSEDKWSVTHVMSTSGSSDTPLSYSSSENCQWAVVSVVIDGEHDDVAYDEDKWRRFVEQVRS